MKKRGLLLFLCFLLLVSCAGEKATEKFNHTIFNIFDTVTSVVGYETKEENFIESMTMLEQRMKEYNDLFDIYHEYPGLNNVSTVNAMAGKEPVKVDEELIRLLNFPRNGMKNRWQDEYCHGSRIKLWHDARGNGSNGQAYFAG